MLDVRLTEATTAMRRAAAHLADVASLHDPGNPHEGMGATRSMNALRVELTRRGWD